MFLKKSLINTIRRFSWISYSKKLNIYLLVLLSMSLLPIDIQAVDSKVYLKSEKTISAKETLAKGQEQWKKGELNEALITLEKVVAHDSSSKQSAKVLRSMQLQKKKLDVLLKESTDFIDRNNYEDAKKSLKKASWISSQYESYQSVLQKLTDVQNDPGENIATEDEIKRIKSLLASSKKFQDIATKNYAEALLLLSKDIGKLQLFTIDKALWDKNTSQYGWMVFFSSAIRIYNKDPLGLPIVGYYNPYSDTLLITVWGEDKKNYKIVDAEIIMGNMLHKKGDLPSHIPLWLQNKRNYKVSLGLEIAQTIVSFEDTFSSSTYSSWRNKLQILYAKDRVLKFNYVGVSLMLNRHLLDILNYINPKKDDIKLIKLKKFISKIIELLSTGKIDKILTDYREITPESIKVIKSISPKWFKALKISAFLPTSDRYLIFFSSSLQTDYSLCFSAKYINDRIQIEIDLLGFQYFYDEFKVRLEKIKKGDL